MGMIKKYLLLFICSFWGYNISAQSKANTDTIRRELTVENERYIKVGKETPLSFDIDILKPQVKSVTGDFDFSKSNMYTYSISHVDRMPSFVYPDMIEKKNRGYVNVFGGLMYNLGIVAGIDAINKKNHKLSLNLSSLWTNHKFLQQGLINKISDLCYNPDVRYDYRKDDRNYHVSVDLYGGYRNYYGVCSPTDLYDAMPSITPQRNYNHFAISAGGDNLGMTDSKWNYFLNAKLNVSNSRYDEYNFESINSISAIGVYADAMFKYSLNNEHSFNLYPKVENYIYSNDKTHNMFYTDVSPTYRYSSSNADMFWIFEMGAGVTFNNKSLLKGEQNMYFWPKMKIGISYGDFFSADLDMAGGDEITDMRELESIMPYYSFANSYWTTQNKIKAKLDLSFLITPDLRLSAFSGMVVKSNALQFSPRYVSDDKTSVYNVIFASYSNDYTKYNMGLNIDLRLPKDIIMKAGLEYSIFSGYEYEVVQEPKFKGMFSIAYKPVGKWMINILYNFKNGIKYRDVNNAELYNTLPLYQSVTANVNYSVLDYLTLYSTIQTSLSKNTAALFPYYPRQDNVFLLGLNFHF